MFATDTAMVLWTDVASISNMGALPGYIGMGPDQSLLPYFFALAVWVMTAIVSVFWSPIKIVLQRFRRGSRPSGQIRPPEAARTAEPPSEGAHENS